MAVFREFRDTGTASLFSVTSIHFPDPYSNMTHVAVNFTVQFHGIGYKMIEPLETSLASRGMLGSMPVTFVDMVSIDGNYVTIIVLIAIMILHLLCF